MLDLQARIHLDEIELAILVEELDRADAEIAELLDGGGDGLADGGAGCIVDDGRGGFLEHLLVAALQRAVAFAKMDDIAMAVGDDLDFDVPRLLEILLHVNRIVAERGLGFGARRCEGEFEFFGRVRAPSCRVRRRRLSP